VFNVNQCLAVKRRVYESDLTQALLSKKMVSALPVDEKAEPVFIVGCGHSGTSLLCAVLDSHPELRALPGENYNFWAWFDRDKVLSRFQSVFEGIANDGLRPLEKTPRHIYVLPQILHYYPKSKVIFLVRDPRGVAASIKRRTGSLRKGYKRWVKDNSRILDYLEDDRIRLVKFEDFLLENEKTLKDICCFLDLAFDPILLNHNENARGWYGAHQEASEHAKRRHKQINKPIDPAFVTDWKERLVQEEINEVQKVCGPLMMKFGYKDER